MRKKLLFTFTLLLVLLGSVFAQQRTITGTVKSVADGTPLPGVTVMVKGTSVGVSTNFSGQYSISIPPNAETLQFSFIGMNPIEIPIGSSSVINADMTENTMQLDEVVVTALGIKKEQKAIGFSAQNLSNEDISVARDNSISHYLSGKVAGVQVSKTASGIGGSSVVTIRGNSSLTGTNQPLYVVDGVPITNQGNSSGGLWGEIDYGDGIGDINPEDVESMTVLKGPNASALYGSRGANGVILITTKGGMARKGIGVEITSNVFVDRINQVPTFQNSYATGYEETNLYGSLKEIPAGSGVFYETMDTWHGDSWGPPLDGRRTIVDPFVYPADKNTKTLVLLPQDKNNVRDFYELGVTTNNSVAFSGGNEKTTARLSLGNTQSKGIIPNERLDRTTIDLRTTSQLTDKLAFNAKVNYINSVGDQRPALGSTNENVARGLATMGRYVPLSWLKEYYETTGDWGRWPGVGYNPYYVLNELKNHDETDRLIGFASVNYDITPWLSVMGRTGIDTYTDIRTRSWPVGASGSDNSKGRFLDDTYRIKENNSDLLLTANKSDLFANIGGTLSIGASVITQQRNRIGWDARNFKAPGVYDVSNAQDVRPSYSLWKKQMQSVYFTGGLSYKEYLFLDVTGRNDWSSTLGKDNYSFFYPSVSTSFVFTEAFGIGTDILSFGKVRLSWAQVGNDSDPYLTTAGYTPYTMTFNGNGLSSMSGRIPLFDLKNELTESYEFGTDLRFLQNRIGIDLTYYNSKTTNQILPVTISNASGYSSVVINAGEVQNKGLEAVLNLKPVQTASGFRWDIAFNFASNKSKVVELAPGVETLLMAESYPNDIEARPGEPLGNIIGYAYKRAPDGQKIVGSGGNYERENEMSVLGNMTPDWIGGLNNTLGYKGFSFNFLVDFVQGGELSSSTKYHMVAKGTGVFTTEGRRVQDIDDAGNQLPLVGILPGVVEVLDGEGNVTGYEPNTKAVDGQTYWATRAWSEIGEEFVLDASYIILREVILGYNFKPALISKTPFAGASISVVGRNLFYLEEHMQGMGVSPESQPNTSAGAKGIESFSLPSTRSFGLNIKLTF